MKLLKNLLLFQRKIIFTSYPISILIGVLTVGGLKVIGLSFVIIAPCIQYLFYDLKNANQYYYYYNLGITYAMLWASTCAIGLINLLILIAI